MKREIIRTENLEKIYEGNGVPVHALRGISLVVEEGEFMAIAGPSGSGKTTLLNLIGALDKPTRGKVFLENEELGLKTQGELSKIRLQTIGFVFQAYNLIPVLTAGENIEFKMMLLGIPDKQRREKVLEIMETLQIAELIDKLPNEMSGGQQQRVAIARAIVNNPPIVIADEPTANLDSVTAGNLIDLMEQMSIEKNITFFFSSHDKQVLERAKRVVILRDGKID